MQSASSGVNRQARRCRTTVALSVTLICLAVGRVRADLEFREPVANVGVVRTGQRLSHRFIFANRGSEPVEMRAAQTSCGCLKPSFEPRICAPGHEGSVVLEVNTLSQAAGAQVWTIQVVYQTGAASCQATLCLKAHVVADVTVLPAAMTLFTDRALTSELVLTDRRDRPLSVVRVETSSSRVRALVQGQSAGVARIRLTVAADCPEGHHEEAIVIATDDPDYAQLRVPVTLVKRPRGRLSSSPREVTLLAEHGKPSPSRIVLVHGSRDDPVHIESASADHPGLSLHWAQGPGPMATLRLSLAPDGLEVGTFATSVHVAVGGQVHETLTIPVLCTVK
jgi:hypothetical protein